MTDSDSSSPPRKIKRFQCNCAEYKNKLNELNDDLKKRDKIIQDQLKFIAEVLAKQQVLLNRMATKQTEIQCLAKHFPLENEESLNNLNKRISAENRDEYIDAIKAIILPSGIIKNLRNILSAKITHEFNIEGVQGKKSLKSLENFYSVLLDSIPENSEEQLRKAIQLQKKRFFKQLAAKKIKLN